MREELTDSFFSTLIKINAPWATSFAVVSSLDMKNITSIICMLIGVYCTVMVAVSTDRKNKQAIAEHEARIRQINEQHKLEREKDDKTV